VLIGNDPLTWRVGQAIHHARLRVMADVMKLLADKRAKGELFVQAEQPGGSGLTDNARDVMRFQSAGFGILLPATSADALSANLYGHSTWHPLSRAER
jgi:hypothetical protein